MGGKQVARRLECAAPVLLLPSSTPGIPDQWNVSFCLLVLLDLWNVFNWFSVPSYASSQLRIVCGA